MSRNPHPGTHPDADQLSVFVEGAATAQEREQMLAHLANHETHHRGELAAMFALMNVAHPEDEVIQYFLDLSGQKRS